MKKTSFDTTSLIVAGKAQAPIICALEFLAQKNSLKQSTLCTIRLGSRDLPHSALALKKKNIAMRFGKQIREISMFKSIHIYIIETYSSITMTKHDKCVQ